MTDDFRAWLFRRIDRAHSVTCRRCGENAVDSSVGMQQT